MLVAFQHLKEWFPEVKQDVWTAGYNVLGAELGVHRDLLARDTSISILNQYIAELHLSEANLDKEPDMETLGKPKGEDLLDLRESLNRATQSERFQCGGTSMVVSISDPSCQEQRA